MDQYVNSLRKAWNYQDGDVLASLLSLRLNLPINTPPDLYVGKIMEFLPSPVDDLVLQHIKTLMSINQGDLLMAYTHHNSAIQILVKILQLQKEENWMLPVMHTMCLELRLLAMKTERLKKNKALKPNESLEKCADTLMSCFRICAADSRCSEDDSKRWGMLALVNQMLKVYFKINKLHLCKPIIRAIDALAIKDQFAIAQQVTYKFFVGRKAMFDNDYKMADEYLTFAFQHCHKRSRKNKRLILTYLIPVKMLLGFVPKQSLLRKYNLLEFYDLIESVKRGNIQSLDEVMKVQETFLINAGIYLIVEKLKLIAYRNLFKKVYLVMNTHQLDIQCLQCALQVYGQSHVDMDETVCLVANLIYDGKVKGYISHQHKKLVISKQNPFPKLSSIL